MTGLVIGVDGGGTRSRALVLDSEGLELGVADGPPGLVDPRSPQTAVEAVDQVVRKAMEAAGGVLPGAVLWAGLAGAGREAERVAVEKGVRERGLADLVRVGTDVEAAHYDVFRGGAGILLVSGTGSMVWGVDGEGRAARVGGWGELLGDEGSGYRMGLDGLRAILRARDGRDPPTVLTETLLTHIEVADPEALPAWSAHASKADVAALSTLVVGAARTGDTAAARIVHRALAQLRELLRAVIERLEPWPAPPGVALVGGLARQGAVLRPGIAAVVEESGGTVVEAAVLPERGAAMLALAEMRGG